MKRRIVLKVSIISIIIFIVCIIIITTSQNNITTHRRQSWLKEINWDTDRTHYTGKGIVIAVVDTGVDLSTPELEDDIIAEYSVLKNEKKVSDTSHGTAICTIITGISHDSKQTIGIAVDTKLISIDVTDDENGIVEIQNLIAGIQLAIEKNVDIINISVGCHEDSEDLQNIIKSAKDNGIIVVCSGGNYMENNILYPGKYKESICVGSMSKKQELVSPVGQLNKKVLYLPGENIVTAIGADTYAGCKGTSFSTAICSGMIALLLEKNDDKQKVFDYLQELEDNKITDINKLIENYD